MPGGLSEAVEREQERGTRGDLNGQMTIFHLLEERLADRMGQGRKNTEARLTSLVEWRKGETDGLSPPGGAIQAQLPHTEARASHGTTSAITEGRVAQQEPLAEMRGAQKKSVQSPTRNELLPSTASSRTTPAPSSAQKS